jgi:hypothetical protein
MSSAANNTIENVCGSGIAVVTGVGVASGVMVQVPAASASVPEFNPFTLSTAKCWRRHY